MGSKKTKCLIIHGFGGGVHEVKPLAEYLIGLNYEVFCPTLQGHSGTRKDMNKATYSDWIDSAEREFLRLKETGDEILLIGFSMGGLIAFSLAYKYNIKAIVTINTPIFYWNLLRVFLNLVDDIKCKKCNHIRRYLQAKSNSPFLAMIQFLLLLRQTKSKLEKISCPILIIQAEDDDTVRRKSVDYIYEHVSSEKKRIKYFHEGGHLILLSPVADQVYFCVEDFIQDQ
ncbi:esterase/lipase [Desulfitobacterium dichloroeliminans LMG P-21439]|uniref:Esterase/lipase n=1 Tax=Desulfitobacterium dichloroeliminans (strain LMG P-21439 / DCA1) TaxID=871963 RepID=L0F6J2_DESDL|nr:alpha/beta fold hydrolase [Desulfitobacterium dichloroeliminans]AGA68276.1 esterase/lipase [Desulfitobacterium dichloroeliminans LMG P-21439]